MAGIKLSPEDSEFSQPSRAPASADLASVVSDDDRSVAADSWSIKSDYGSTMDDDQRHADAAEVLSSAVLGSADYRFVCFLLLLIGFFLLSLKFRSM